jgi:hypothetical protein
LTNNWNQCITMNMAIQEPIDIVSGDSIMLKIIAENTYSTDVEFVAYFEGEQNCSNALSTFSQQIVYTETIVPGPTGAQGATGAQGTPGTAVLTGATGPIGPVGGANMQYLFNYNNECTGSDLMTYSTSVVRANAMIIGNKKYYMYTGGSIQGAITPDITIMFANYSFSAVINANLINRDNYDMISSMTLNCNGGNYFGTGSSSNLSYSPVVIVNSNGNTAPWSTIVDVSTNSITIRPSVTSTQGYIYTINIELWGVVNQSRVIDIIQDLSPVIVFEY